MIECLLIHRRPLTFFTLSALIAADRVLIPFDCDVFSKRALQTLIENVLETQDDHNDHLEIEGIVVNQFQAQAKLPREVVQQFKDEGLARIGQHVTAFSADERISS